jgi:hypothetical protein
VVALEVNEKLLVEYVQRLSPADTDVAQIVVNYVIAQLNNESLIGNINEFEYRVLLRECIDGLYCLVYIDLANGKKKLQKTEDGKLTIIESENLVLTDKQLEDLKRMQDSLYFAAKNLSVMCFTRVRNGLDHDLKKAEIEAKSRPIIATH